MNTYTFNIETTNDSEEIVIDAMKASMNQTEGIIQAVISPGHFRVIRIPSDWTSIECVEQLGPEEQAAYDKHVAEEKAMDEAHLEQLQQQQRMMQGPLMPPGGQMPAPPIPVMPPGQ